MWNWLLNNNKFISGMWHSNKHCTLCLLFVCLFVFYDLVWSMEDRSLPTLCLLLQLYADLTATLTHKTSIWIETKIISEILSNLYHQLYKDHSRFRCSLHLKMIWYKSVNSIHFICVEILETHYMCMLSVAMQH